MPKIATKAFIKKEFSDDNSIREIEVDMTMAFIKTKKKGWN